MFIGIDIGGSHVSSALIQEDNYRLVPESFCKGAVDPNATAGVIIKQWADVIKSSLAQSDSQQLEAVGIAMPGPFDYINGIGLIEGVEKYRSLFGVNIRRALAVELNFEKEIPIFFQNDAACFGMGEYANLEDRTRSKVIAVTLGTGFGAAFIDNGIIIRFGDGVPEGGELYNQSYKGGMCEDYISTRGLVARYKELTGKRAANAKEIATRAMYSEDTGAKKVFKELGNYLAESLAPWLQSFGADHLIIGGNIAKAASLFLPTLKKKLAEQKLLISIKISNQMEQSAIQGAALFAKKESINQEMKQESWRKSMQPLLPHYVSKAEAGDTYRMYPYRTLTQGTIMSGYRSLADWILRHRSVIIDGFTGNNWRVIQTNLAVHFKGKSIRVLWLEASAFLKNEAETESLVSPFLGKKNDVWGKKSTLSLSDFFEIDKLTAVQPNVDYDVTIMIGTGAALCNWNAPVVYVDLPKNELQYRMRAGNAGNLGNQAGEESYANMYKRSYFVDWVVLNHHRQQIKDRIAIVADGQWRETINWCERSSIERGLLEAAHNVIRVRPWFEAGAWGGQWMKGHIPSLNQNEINYAWSFELIVPENGIIFESNGHLLEIAFDWLMESQVEAVMGKDASRFGLEFPIRFDFLDTFEGGNLSIQCHPRLSYIQEHFGETITQDETYYILDCKEESGVYLGFQEDIDPAVFKRELEKSNQEGTPLEIGNFVQFLPSHKHDLFLIPNGTIHSSGVNNMVLEISATPYIFTFKMYDWLRLDLNGQPRPINIDRAFENLHFERKGAIVREKLVSHPCIMEKGEDYQIVHLPTHSDHFYDVHRVELSDRITIETRQKCHVMMLVEGTSIIIITKGGERHRFLYAETFVIPAATGSYTIMNEGENTAKVIQAFIK